MSVDSLITIYMLERFLYRLSISAHAGEFALKGGLLMSVYHDGELLRPTKDLDLNGFSEDGNVEVIEAVVRAVLATPLPEDDGVRFLLETLRIVKSREGIIPGGKIYLTARLHTATKPIEIDVGFNNVITPDAPLREVPTLFSGQFPQPVIRTYPLETVIAEKVHAMAEFGILNTRHKDYYDLWKIGQTHPLDGETLASAIQRTFDHQERKLEADMVGLTIKFASDNQPAWLAFLRKIGKDSPASYPAVMEEVRGLLIPVIEAALGDALAPGEWVPAVGWQAPGFRI